MIDSLGGVSGPALVLCASLVGAATRTSGRMLVVYVVYVVVTGTHAPFLGGDPGYR